jgi:hypothetical protein
MSSVEKVLQFRVFLEDIRPPVWRCILVSDRFTLAQLHKIMQLTFGWQDFHLHEFTVRDRRYGRPDYDNEDPELLDERKVRLRDLDLSVGNRIGYAYDFGDNWQHLLLLEDTQAAHPAAGCPACLAGARAAPPEDVGGSSGYEEFLEAIADPKHEEHDHMISWVGVPFDPEAFDLNRINQGLRRSFQSRRKASN